MLDFTPGGVSDPDPELKNVLFHQVMVMLMLSGLFENHCPAKGVAKLRAGCCEMFVPSKASGMDLRDPSFSLSLKNVQELSGPAL